MEQNTNTGALVRRLLSTDYADKVIVTTIQKLGLALDPRHHQDYQSQLAPLRDKRVVLIFDECHRSQFGENHQAIKEFFPKAQLFGFTGTPIFEDNANYTQIDGQEASYRTTEDIFQQRLHAYTITHAIEDKNVLRFHIDYFKSGGKADGQAAPKAGTAPARQAVVDSILAKHDAATLQRRFNAVLATQSINDAVAYYQLLRQTQAERQAQDPDFRPLHIACVFSPPAEGNADVRQIQEDLPQEKQDNQQDPDGKKAALKGIIADYNQQYGTNHSIAEFDQYYQDVQQRIKAQKWPVADYPRAQRIDITIVVDMLLTGFDSKYLNTLYVDKNLKHHGLIQAFSRTNRVLNDTKPYGNVLDFRQQQGAVDAAIGLFSGLENKQDPKEIWLVDPAPVVLARYEAAVQQLDTFMQGQGLPTAPEEIANLKGDAARGQFIEKFKEVQRLRTQLDQYTDLGAPEQQQLETLLPTDDLRAFRSQYLETARRLRDQQGRGTGPGDGDPGAGQQLDFEFVLFASALIDYDYIMGLMAASTAPGPPKKQKMTREQVIDLLMSSANLTDDADDLRAYFRQLPTDRPYSPEEIRAGFAAYQAAQTAAAQAALATRHGLAPAALTAFVEGILRRMIFDGEALGDLLAPLGLGWKTRAAKEQALMAELIPLLKKMAPGRDISGLKTYE
ncbi:type I restriction endonuclease subunit R, EcoR124 family [Hymenobacter aerophilus]|uniref:type I restriction endonuclease subunit R, EcoR124 family n=1 Tax=Hymenobacter aerophilus TaxID=119644 RepID=UPI001F0AC36D|nr:DEAD/DEAH box helicase family protein [Hymenobacter aerophilus]